MTGETLIDEYYFQIQEHYEQGDVITNSSHLRIDYDPTATGHDICHLQLGSISKLRIGSDALMTPFTFWHWVIKQLLDANGTEVFQDVSAQQNYQQEFTYQSRKKKQCGVTDSIHLTSQ